MTDCPVGLGHGARWVDRDPAGLGRSDLRSNVVVQLDDHDLDAPRER
jgi:hypothetical protein